MPYSVFDRNQLFLKPLSERDNDLNRQVLINLNDPVPEFECNDLEVIADRIISAKAAGATIMIMMGAHVIRAGANPLLIDLMRRGFISLIGTNGASAIHDLEFAMIGETTESVPRYIQEGQFGLWRETGRVNDAAIYAKEHGIGFGEAVGKLIAENPDEYPFHDTSLFAAGYQLGIPITVHVGIGQDIVHEHPNCDGASIGAASYRDFLTLAYYVQNLEHGVILNIGSAVMGPEVYLKALSMARNVAKQNNQEIKHFTSAVFDLVDLGEKPNTEAKKSEPVYYFRPYKTILVRTVADGGESFYVRGNHRVTVPNLYRLLIEKAGRNEDKFGNDIP